MAFFTKDGQHVGGLKVESTGKRKEIFDEFRKAMSTPVKEQPDLNFQGTLDERPDETLNITIPRGSWNIMESIVRTAIKYVPGDMVEIGMGESTEILADIAHENNLHLYSCDIQMGGMFQVFDKPLFENHHCFVEGSEKFMEEYGGSPSIVFIDGEHKYETVKKEGEFFLPRINKGGLMFLHDTMPVNKKSIEPDSKGYNPGDVYKFRQELERDHRYDVLTFPYSAHNMGLTMVMVHGDHRPHWRENGRASG